MFSESAVQRRTGTRPGVFVAIGAAAAVLLALVLPVVVRAWTPVHALSARALSAPFVPSEANGALRTPASLDDTGLPAIAGLDPGLLSALRDAATAAAADGIEFAVTSGWRSPGYQRWLLDDAMERYGSESIARRYVAPPERSRHVTGDAVDAGPVEAQSWLLEHGSRWGICQIYANERWHFEIATDPGGVCPELLPDAAG